MHFNKNLRSTEQCQALRPPWEVETSKTSLEHAHRLTLHESPLSLTPEILPEVPSPVAPPPPKRCCEIVSNKATSSFLPRRAGLLNFPHLSAQSRRSKGQPSKVSGTRLPPPPG